MASLPARRRPLQVNATPRPLPTSNALAGPTTVMTASRDASADREGCRLAVLAAAPRALASPRPTQRQMALWVRAAGRSAKRQRRRLGGRPHDHMIRAELPRRAAPARQTAAAGQAADGAPAANGSTWKVRSTYGRRWAAIRLTIVVGDGFSPLATSHPCLKGTSRLSR